ncbi:MAG: hypothetical protein Q9219_002855 [cf. Caloplaca sp. 3 TL-2023]
MGFFKSLKCDHPPTVGGETSHQNYAPPPGPPPTQQHAPPPGPPPGHNEFLPPPGPPPSHGQPGDAPPPYHDWTVIEDTALLPPPPSLRHEMSPSGNASLSDADRAHEWCKRYPLIRPHQPTPVQQESVDNGDTRLVTPREYQGKLSNSGPGSWSGATVPGGKEACLLSFLPCYFAAADSPLVTEAKKIIYFEVKVQSYGRGRGGDASSIALGYCAMPFPTWRMPGWERGSLGVHGDDGRRYVNDTWGGKDFVKAVQPGETVGLGMELSIPENPPSYGSSQGQTPSMKVEVFFTRNGVKEAGWDIHEELDAQHDLGIEGLDGHFDLYAAIGLFGEVEFAANFHRHLWLWQPV